jgi:hypothetical protein
MGQFTLAMFTLGFKALRLLVLVLLLPLAENIH